MAQTLVTGAFLYLTAKLSPGGTSFVGDRDLGITKGRLKMRDPNNPDSTYTEWIQFTTVTAVGDGTFTYGGLTRSLSQVLNPATSTGSGKTWVAGTEAKLVAMHDQLADMLNGAIVPVYADSTARDAAITAPVNGMSCYNTADGLFNDYAAGAWVQRANGATPNASTTVAGKVEIATASEVTNGTATGGTGAILSVSPDQLIQEINGSTAKTSLVSSDKIPLADSAASGARKAITWSNVESQLSTDYPGVFGGQDGDISGALTITGSNDTLIVKSYRNFAPGANTVTITPTGCVTVIKVSGNLDLTGTTIDWVGKGKLGGTGATGSTPSTAGSIQGFFKDVAPEATITYAGAHSGGAGGGGNIFANGGTGGASGSNPGGVGGSVTVRPYNAADPFVSPYSDLLRYVAQGGSGGGKYSGAANAGGSGGAGGGTLIFLVEGNVTLSGTTVTVAGANGTASVDALGSGGGGGAGGIFGIFYKGTLTGSVTPTVTGGTGGASTGGGAGGAGGARRTAGTVGGAGSHGSYGAGGGGGAGGDYIIAKF